MFYSPKLSLSDILGSDYTQSVIEALSVLSVMDAEKAAAIADEKVDFYPEADQKKNDDLLNKVGTQVIKPFNNCNKGTPTDSYSKASNYASSPITGNGYKLINNARKLGILNATHNNTRGYITRLAERELVRTANGIGKDDESALKKVLSSNEAKILNRVINLETGSLAVEAGIKMMLARFYKLALSFRIPNTTGRYQSFL